MTRPTSGSRPAGWTSRSTATTATTPTPPEPDAAATTAMVRALWRTGVTGTLRHDLHRVRGAHTGCAPGRRRRLRGGSARRGVGRRDPRRGPAHRHARTARGARIRCATSGRPTSPSTGAGRRPPAGGSGSSPSRRSTTRRSTTSAPSSPTASSPRSGTRRRTATRSGPRSTPARRWSTHLGNGAHALIRRHPNYIWDQLAEDRLAPGSSSTATICRRRS